MFPIFYPTLTKVKSEGNNCSFDHLFKWEKKRNMFFIETVIAVIYGHQNETLPED